MSLFSLKTLAAVAMAASLATPAVAQERIKFKAIGQPLATGLIQKNKEQPFFENFAKNTACRSTSTTSRSTR
jgi:ABC-type sugar transport system substrate-binding protein